MLGRFWRSCGGIDSSCVTPAADCGVGVHCLAGSNLPISVISRVMGEGIYIAFYWSDSVGHAWVQPGVVSITRGSRNVRQDCSACATLIQEFHSLSIYSCAWGNFSNADVSSGTFLIGTIASTNRDQPSAQVQWRWKWSDSPSRDETVWVKERTQNEKTDHCTWTQRGPSMHEVGLPQDAARRTDVSGGSAWPVVALVASALARSRREALLSSWWQ